MIFHKSPQILDGSDLRVNGVIQQLRAKGVEAVTVLFRELVRAMGGWFDLEGIDPKAFIGWLRLISVFGLTAAEVSSNARRVRADAAGCSPRWRGPLHRDLPGRRPVRADHNEQA